MSTGTRATNLPVIADFADVLGISAAGTTGRLSSTALGTILAASGPIATALAAAAANDDLTSLTDRVATLETAGGLYEPQGTWSAASGAFPSGATAGDLWEVSTGGTVDSISFVAGDQIVALIDSASTTTYAANWFKRPASTVVSVAGRTGAVTLTKTDVGLGNADNTSDANKPVSTAQQAALDAKAPLASPTFTGTPAAPTASSGTSTTQIATTAFVADAVANVSVDWLETAQTIGLDTTPASSSTFAGTTYAFAEAAERNSTLNTLTFWAAGTGTLKIRRFAKSGDDFSQVGSDLEIIVSSTGLKSLTGGGVDFAEFEVLEGEYLGFYGPSVLGRIVTTGPAFYMSGTGDFTSFIDATTATNIAIQLAFGLRARETDLIRDDVTALDTRVTAAEVVTGGISGDRVIGRDGAFSSASASAVSSPFIFMEPVAFHGVVSEITLLAAATGTVPVKVFRPSGATYVQVGSDYSLTVSATGQRTYTSADFGTISVQPGDVLGWFNSGVVAFASVSGHNEYYGWNDTSPGNVSTLTVNRVDNAKQFQIAFSLTASAPRAVGRNGIVAGTGPLHVEAGASGKLIGHLSYGQSWMDANGSNTAHTPFLSPLYPLRVVTLADLKGPQGWSGAARTASRGLTPMREQNSAVQTPIGAMGNRLAWNMAARGGSGAVFVRSEAHGGRSLAELMPSDDVDYTGTSAAYTNLIAAVTEFVSHAATMNLSAEIGTVTWCQGAADSGTAYATYKTRFERLISEIQTDVRAATGQTRGPTILIVQPPGTDTSGDWPCLQAQVDVAAARADVVLVCAGWAIPQHDTTHFSTAGAVILGEMMANAAEAAAAGLPWSAPYLHSVTRSGSTITAYVGGPHGVVVDTSVATTNHQVSGSPVANYGFSYSGASITGVTVEPRKITITLASSAAGTLGFAYHGSSRGDSKSVNRGTIRADTKAASVYVSNDMPLWLASGYWAL